MKSVAELQNERARILSEAEEILDNADSNDRPVSDDEDQTIQLSMARIDELDKEIDRRSKLEEQQKRQMKASTPVPGADNPGGGSTPAAAAPPQAAAPASIPRAYGKLTAFPKTKEGELRAYRAGMFIRASIYGDV